MVTCPAFFCAHSLRNFPMFLIYLRFLHDSDRFQRISGIFVTSCCKERSLDFPRFFRSRFVSFLRPRVPYAPMARNDGDAAEVAGCCHANQMATKLLVSEIPVWNMRKERGVHSRTDTAPADQLDRTGARANHACRAQFDSAHRP